MGIRISDIARNERTFDFTLEGQTAKVTYRPYAWTPATRSELDESGRDGVVEILSRLLAKWDVVDEHDAVVGVDVDSLSHLPSRFLNAVLDAVNADAGAGLGEPSGSSDGG